MKVYLPNAVAKTQSVHLLHICPAGHLKGQEMPSDWVDDENKPVNFTIKFQFGEAEVPSEIGKYLVEYGMAKKTPLILPRDYA